MVWNWVCCRSSYPVWNCNYLNEVKTVVVLCWSVVWVVSITVLFISDDRIDQESVSSN